MSANKKPFAYLLKMYSLGEFVFQTLEEAIKTSKEENLTPNEINVYACFAKGVKAEVDWRSYSKTNLTRKEILEDIINISSEEWEEAERPPEKYAASVLVKGARFATKEEQVYTYGKYYADRRWLDENEIQLIFTVPDV